MATPTSVQSSPSTTDSILTAATDLSASGEQNGADTTARGVNHVATNQLKRRSASPRGDGSPDDPFSRNAKRVCTPRETPPVRPTPGPGVGAAAAAAAAPSVGGGGGGGSSAPDVSMDFAFMTPHITALLLRSNELSAQNAQLIYALAAAWAERNAARQVNASLFAQLTTAQTEMLGIQSAIGHATAERDAALQAAALLSAELAEMRAEKSALEATLKQSREAAAEAPPSGAEEDPTAGFLA